MINEKRIFEFIDNTYSIQDILEQRISILWNNINIEEENKELFILNNQQELLTKLSTLTNEVDNSYKHVIISLLLKRLRNGN